MNSGICTMYNVHTYHTILYVYYNTLKTTIRKDLQNSLFFIVFLYKHVYVHLYGHLYETKGSNDLKFPIRIAMTITGNIFLSFHIFKFLKNIFRLFQK